MSSTGFKPGIYTSTTRPTVPFIGETIFETDTGKIMVYYGTTISWQPRWNYEWGEVGNVERTTTYTMTDIGADISGMSFTWITVLNRIYIPTASFQIHHASGNVAGVQAQIRDANDLGLQTAVEGGTGGGFGTADTSDGRMIAAPKIIGNGLSKTVKLYAVDGAAVGELPASSTTKIVLQVLDRGQAGPPPITN